jgi:hypothetical protein
MDEGQLAELGLYYDEYMFGDRKKPQTQQAIFCLKAIARDVYAVASEDLKKKLTFEQYLALVILPDVLLYLDRRQAKYPVVTPERPAH